MNGTATDPLSQPKEEQDIFNELPDELVVLIFSHLSPEDIACRVTKVCERWLAIARDPVLWDKAILVYNGSHLLEFQSTILFAPSLQRLEINMFHYLDAKTVQSILSSSVSVKCLSFYPSPALPIGCKLSILKMFCNDLNELNMYLDDSYFMSDTHETVFEIFKNMKRLKTLILRGYASCEFINNDLLCNGWESLEVMDISGFTIRQEASLNNSVVPNPWQAFILCILEKRARFLKKLSLPVDVLDLQMGSVIENKFVLSQIESLKICEMCLKAIRNLNYLTALHVVGTSFKHLGSVRANCLPSGTPYSSLFQWINGTPQFWRIRELTLENILDDERNLNFTLVKACINLEYLTLTSGCNSPAQLTRLILQVSQCLTKLCIHQMPGLRSKHLELIACHFPSLKILNLRHNTLTDGILQYYKDHVQPRMPDLELHCDWGYLNKNGGQSWRNNAHTNLFTNSVILKYNNPSSSCDLAPQDRENIRRALDLVNDYDDDDD